MTWAWTELAGSSLQVNTNRPPLAPCRSELAREEPESTAGCQLSSVIVGDHRERARSYRNRGHKKAARKRLFLRVAGLFQAGHLLDGAFELGIGAVGAGTFRRHRVDTGNGFGQDAVEAALVIGTVFPGGGVTDFRCTQQA